MQGAADHPAGRAKASRAVAAAPPLPSPQMRIDREAVCGYNKIGDRLVRAASENGAVDHRVERRISQVPPPTCTHPQ
jgi:hypothetical protein